MKGFSGKEASLPSLLMQETQVLSPCWEDPLEKQMAAHSSTYPDSPMDRRGWWATVHGVPKSQTRLSDLTTMECEMKSDQPRECLGPGIPDKRMSARAARW